MYRTIRNLTGLLFGIITGVLLALAMLPAHSADLANDAPLPKEAPEKAMFTLCDRETENGEKIVVFVTVSYPNGDTLSFDGVHFHGLKNSQETFDYVETAHEIHERVIHCPAKATQS